MGHQRASTGGTAWLSLADSKQATGSGPHPGARERHPYARLPQANPIRSYAEHTHEVHSVTWNPLRRDCFVSTSWDDTAKVWSPDAPVSIRTFREHSYWCVTQPPSARPMQRIWHELWVRIGD